MEWMYDDGGRKNAGYRGDTGDCGVRAVAIASGKPYQEVYDSINEIAKQERPRKKSRSNSRDGIWKKTLHKYIVSLGGEWISTMGIGTGCQVHMRAGEMPDGRVVVRVSRHYSAVIDGVIRDTHDPSRDGDRCVYGYWQF